MSFIPDGRRLRQIREQQEYSIELLAEAAGVGEKTIRNLESGRTRRARLPTLKALAAVLDIDVADIARPAGAAPSGVGAAPAAPHPAGLPEPTRLEQIVARELTRGVGTAPLGTVHGPVMMLSAKKFQDIMTAFVLHEGERLWLPGVVLRQRGISEAEAQALSSRCGVGARFLVSQRAALSGEDAFHVTVFTTRPEHTRLLQERIESGRDVTLVLRVLLAEGNPAAPAEAGAQRGRFGGFPMYGSQTLHPWALVVEEVLDAGA